MVASAVSSGAVPHFTILAASPPAPKKRRVQNSTRGENADPMSIASLSSPITLVIPSLWVVAGIFLCCSVLFSIVGLWPRKEPLFLAFGALCMTITGFMTSAAVSYSAATVPDMLQVLRVGISFAMLSLPLFYACVCLYTHYSLRQRWTWLVGIFSVCLLLLNLEEWSTARGLFARSPCASGLSRRCG